MKRVQYCSATTLVTLLITTAGCASGGIPKAKYETLAKKYDQLKLENSGECAGACGECNAKVRRLEAELAAVDGARPRDATARTTPEVRPADPPHRAPPERRRTSPRRPPEPPPMVIVPIERPLPPERRSPPERRPPPRDPPASVGDDATVSHGLASNLNEWAGTIGAGLSTVGVLRAVLAQKARFRQCYQKALKKRPGLTAKLTLGFLVTTKGKVRRLRDGSPRSRDRKLRRVIGRLSKCARRAMKKVAFPPPSGNKSVPVIYPIHYKP
jgi:hypothetical protein